MRNNGDNRMILLIDRTDSQRGYISNSIGGVYMVSKRNILKEFRWGYTANASQDLKTGANAHSEMIKFINARKDSSLLHTTVLEFSQ